MSFKKLYLKNRMVLNFHIFLTIIYCVGSAYALYAFQNILNIPMIIPFLFMLYVFYIWILGSHLIFIEMIVFTKGVMVKGNIVDYEKKNKKLIPQIRFRKQDRYETYSFYREYFDSLDVKTVRVYFYRNWWTCQELAFLEV